MNGVRQSLPTNRDRGFSLVELLVTIVIIGVVISIIIPTLSSAKQAAKEATSRQLMTNLLTSVEQFKTDHGGKAPGYFSPEQMGSLTNQQIGLTAMENAMIDLAGANAFYNPADGAANDVITLSADRTEEIELRASLIGADSAGYFSPPKENFVGQVTGKQFAGGGSVSGGPSRGAGQYDNAAGEGQPQMPDLIDAFGTPILLWITDSGRVPQVSSAQDFAGLTSTDPALLYWNSNAGFLKSTSLGKRSYDLSKQPSTGQATSLIGQGVRGTNGSQMPDIMMAMFGAPAFPVESTLTGNAYDDAVASRARGDVIIHSGGRDGLYFSTQDPGLRRVATSAAFDASSNSVNLKYGIIFAEPNGTRRTDESGRNTSIDFVDAFDDILVTN